MQQGRGGGRHSREQRFEEVIRTLHQLPAEEFVGRDELMALSAHDLKVTGHTMCCYTEADCSSFAL